MKTSLLIAELDGGVFLKPQRFEGDAHKDSDGPVDIAATDTLMAEAASRIYALSKQIQELTGEFPE